jgi:hypothetical protein
MCLWAWLAVTLCGPAAKGQAITNLGDTISIGATSVLYVDGDFSNTNNGPKSAFIKNYGTLNITGNLSAIQNTIYAGKKDSLILSGTGTQAFPGFRYGIILVNGGGVKNLSGNAYVLNKLILSKGILGTGKDTIRLDSLATIKEDIKNYLVGNLIYTRNLKSNKTYTNGNIGFDIITATQAPGITTIFRGNGPNAIQNGFCSVGIERFFDIKPAVNKDLLANIVFYYLPFELNGYNQADLQIYRSLDSGKLWVAEGYTFLNASQNSISLNAMDTMGRFTAGSSSKPLVNVLKAGPNQTVCSGKPVTLGGSPKSGHFYNWTSSPKGFTSNVSSPTVAPLVTTTYYLNEGVTFGSCKNKDSVTITVIPSPVATWKFKNIGKIYSFTADDSLETTYAWDFGDGNTASNFKAAHVYAKDGTYKVSLIVTGANGCTAEFDSTRLFRVGINPDKPGASGLKVFPNPFSNTTNVSFKLDHAAFVHISLSDITGRQLGTITRGEIAAGEHQIEINGDAYHLQPGIYFIKTQIDDDIEVNRMVRAGY